MYRGQCGGMASCETETQADRVVITGKVGDTGKGTLCIRNPEFRRRKIRVCADSGVVGPGGKDVESPITITPNEFELGPWQTRTVEVTAEIVSGMKVGVDYTAKVSAYAHHQSANLVVRRVG